MSSERGASESRLLPALVGGGVLLVVVSLAWTLWGSSTESGVPFDGYERLEQSLAVDGESNLPTWYSSALLLLCAAALARTARATPGRGRRPWTALAVVFVYLSADEVSQLHEMGNQVVDRLGVETGLAFGWVALAVPSIVVLAVFLLPFLRRLPRDTSYRFVGAGGVFVGGAVGLEVLGGRFWEDGGQDAVAYVLTRHAEELCEMVAAALFAVAVLRHHELYRSAAAPAGGVATGTVASR